MSFIVTQLELKNEQDLLELRRRTRAITDLAGLSQLHSLQLQQKLMDAAECGLRCGVPVSVTFDVVVAAGNKRSIRATIAEAETTSRAGTTACISYDLSDAAEQFSQGTWLAALRNDDWEHAKASSGFPHRISAPVEATAPMRPELILVAEDHPINQQVALLLLRSLGFEAQIAENGSQVIERVKCSPYHLIFMDCQMPGMDGFETTRQLRSLEKDNGTHVPIIAMTAQAIKGSREQCLAAGMDDYISKPVEPAKLRSIMDTWLPAGNAQTGADSMWMKQNACSDGEEKFESRATVEKLTAKMGARVAIKLLSMFVSHTPEDLQRIGICVADRDAAGVIRAAHTLKGVFGTLCAEHLRVLCTEIEAAAHERDWARVTLTLKIFNKQTAELEQLITDRMIPSSTEDKS